VDDVRATHRELSGKGVRFDGEPFEASVGVFATMRDPWGNIFVLAGDTGSRQPARRTPPYRPGRLLCGLPWLCRVCP
jgi:hypothetical protein